MLMDKLEREIAFAKTAHAEAARLAAIPISVAWFVTRDGDGLFVPNITLTRDGVSQDYTFTTPFACYHHARYRARYHANQWRTEPHARAHGKRYS